MNESTLTESTHSIVDNHELSIHNNNSGNNPAIQYNKKLQNNSKAEKDRIIDVKRISDECLNPNCYQCVVHNIVNLSDTQLT